MRPATLPTLLVLAAVALACSEEPTEPATGTLRITTTTIGTDLDPDGYTLQVTGFGPRQVLPNGTTQVYQVKAGTVNLFLTGVASNCAVTGDGDVDVTANATLDVALQVACSELPGNLRVEVKTRGPDPDLGGYEILMDGTSISRAPDSGVVLLNDLPGGTHTIAIDEVASNCTSPGPQSVDVEIDPAQLAVADFLLVCTHTPKIATTSQLPGFPALITMNEDATGVFVLTPDTLFARRPAWSPDGSRIAFSDLFNAVWLVDPDGRNLRPLGVTSAFTFDPAWSPDGTRLAMAYAPDHTLKAAIYTSNRTGKQLKQLTPGTDYDTHPAYSPDGTRIVFQREFPGSFRHLVVVNTDGTGEVEITTGLDDQSPAWSPDGTLIAFSAQGPLGDTRIYLVHPDGSGRESLIPVTNQVGGYTPTWINNGAAVLATDGLRIYAVDLTTRQELWSTDTTPLNVDGLSWRQ